MQVRIVLMAILLGFPLLEAVVLVRLAQDLGWWVLAWVVLAACAGAALIKEARFAMLTRVAAGVAQGRFPITALTDTVRTVLAGLLLIFPGVVSDSSPSRCCCFPVRAWPSNRRRTGAPPES